MFKMVYPLRRDIFSGDAFLNDDEGLLARVRALDGRALAEIHDLYYPELYRYLMYRTSDPQVADDLASDVFMRLLDALRRGRPPASIRGWLFGVAAHVLADHYRRRERRPQVELSEDLPAGDHDLEDGLNRKLMTVSVQTALRRLTEEQQAVLALRFGDGWSVADTAAVLKKSETAVKQLQFRALAALRRALDLAPQGGQP
jgi:RNA polymerase sigma-70 factor (ECF subfamily)